MNDQKKKINFSFWPALIPLVAIIILLFFMNKQKQQLNVPRSKKSSMDITKTENRTSQTQRVEVDQTTLPEIEIVESNNIKLTPKIKEVIEQLRQQAKVQMAAGYTAMIAYRGDFERYTTDFNFSGWSPQNSKIGYKMGYLKPFHPEKLEGGYDNNYEDPTFMSTDEFVLREDGSKTTHYEYTEYVADINLADYAKYCDYGCTATKDTFEYLVVTPFGPNKFDVWSINHKKEMIHRVDGLTGKPVELK